SLTPIQCWFFEAAPVSPGHFDQSVTLELVDGVDEAALRAALDALLVRHDALRMRFEQVDGGWRQWNPPPQPVEVLDRCGLSALGVVRQDDAVATMAAGVHAGFDLGHGPLLRAVLFDLGSGRRPVLLVAVHHLVVDGVSWRILLDDLDTGYRQALRGEAVD